ncbi:MAG: peptidase [Ruminococcus sp.]|nr:peptidase [Ruminococcus sp.]
MGIVVAVLIFGMIIFIHELGHFAVAKACGVKVNEFALGMGPKLFGFKKGETAYSLRLLPIGGFCSMEGEDADSSDARAFGNKKVWQRILIVIAGAVMNVILGFVLIVIMHSMEERLTSTTVSWFAETQTSHSTGLEIGDKILEINGMKIYTDMDISYHFQSDEDAVFDMVVLRDGKKVELEGVTFAKDENGLHIDFKVVPDEVNVGNVLKYSVKSTISYARLVWISLGDLITGTYKINDLSGPVGIVDSIGQVVESEKDDDGIDWRALADKLLFLAAFMTINVGIFNLLPLPALDGGRLIFLVVEAIRRKKINPEHEGMVHLIGLALLMLLMLVVTFNDIVRIIKR